MFAATAQAADSGITLGQWIVIWILCFIVGLLVGRA